MLGGKGCILQQKYKNIELMNNKDLYSWYISSWGHSHKPNELSLFPDTMNILPAPNCDQSTGRTFDLMWGKLIQKKKLHLKNSSATCTLHKLVAVIGYFLNLRITYYAYVNQKSIFWMISQTSLDLQKQHQNEEGCQRGRHSEILSFKNHFSYLQQ